MPAVSLTPQQEDAADYRQLDACVVAGPGSGKTTVLVERYRALIEERGFEPRQILAITFTEKAAANMKARLAELFAHDGLRLRELESAYVSTIHGFCARVLRENAIAAGVDPRFAVLDARESEELQYACLNAALDELVAERRAEMLALIEALQTPYVIGDLRSTYDGIRSAGKTVAQVRAMEMPPSNFTAAAMAATLRQLIARWPVNLTAAKRTSRAEFLELADRIASVNEECFEELVGAVKSCPINLSKVPPSEKEPFELYKKAMADFLADAVDHHTAPFRALVFDVIQRFDDLYNERKQDRGALDFNDLERFTVDLLRRSDEVSSRIRAQFRQVMLDEFQDINQQQSDLIQLIRAEDVFFAVGDINQSIYGFRHARPEIFESYQSSITASEKHSVDLLDNFRSRNEILRCVESLLNGCEGIVARELVAGSPFAAKQTPSIEVLKVQSPDGDEEPAEKEARWIAHRVLSLRGTLALGPEGSTRFADFADFAVLCRAGDSMKPILRAFDQAGIPYVSGRRQSFLLSREGRDITALLHTIANPRDTIALATVLRSPLASLGDEALLRIRLLAGSLSGGLNMIAHDPARLADFERDDAVKVERFIRNLKAWRELQPVVSLELLLIRVLRDCGFDWTPGTTVSTNIESFLQLARTRGDSRRLAEFLDEIESIGKAVNLESDLADKDQGNCVQVMTAHAAKGLEFPVTIIAAMDKGTQRTSAPVTFTPLRGLGLKWSDRGGKRGNSGLEDSWQLRNTEELKEREAAESNRLLYVAMTRAEEHLILSYSRGKNRASNWAKLVDNLFQLDGVAPAAEPFRAGPGTVEASVYVVETEPPPLVADAAEAAASGVLTIERPAVAHQHDSTVSVTSLAVFADCPRKYYLQRYVGWNGRAAAFDPEELPSEDDGPDMNAADLGSAVHDILAGKAVDEVYAEAQRLANVFHASELGRRAASASQAAREWDFILDLDGTLVRGTVDLWFREGGEITLVDYKTDAVVRAEGYGPQLALYALAIERAVGKRPSHAWLHFLRADALVEVPIDDAAVAGVGALLAELRKEQDELRFDLREGDHCRTCQFYRRLCPATV
ncbi:MAG TPA: UvrD-helicase domain-containing protein [Bryobacteraceae bacterium]|nr:UvrD-helicase domain-containing protein [Bryobacteraceae bacterium]